MKVKCDNCHSVFEKKIAEVRRTKHNFCNKQCKSDYYSNKSLEGKYDIKADGCWEFSGSLNNSGYGVVRYEKRTQLAHRVSFKIHNQSVDITEKCVLHACDNPCCVNPDHLFIGSHLDNMNDMRFKGRSNAKLSYKKVAEIRESILSNKELAKAYGVSERTIRYAKNKSKWIFPEPPK